MSWIDSEELLVLKHYFNNDNHANIGDATGLVASTADGNFYAALLTADPTETGTITSETTYTGYDRVAIARTTGGFTCSGTSQVENAAKVTFGQNTVGTPTITYVALCISGTKTTADMFCYAVLDTPLVMAVNDIPEFAAGQLVWTLT